MSKFKPQQKRNILIQNFSKNIADSTQINQSQNKQNFRLNGSQNQKILLSKYIQMHSLKNQQKSKNVKQDIQNQKLKKIQLSFSQQTSQKVKQLSKYKFKGHINQQKWIKNQNKQNNDRKSLNIKKQRNKYFIQNEMNIFRKGKNQQNVYIQQKNKKVSIQQKLTKDDMSNVLMQIQNNEIYNKKFEFNVQDGNYRNGNMTNKEEIKPILDLIQQMVSWNKLQFDQNRFKRFLNNLQDDQNFQKSLKNFTYSYFIQNPIKN